MTSKFKNIILAAIVVVAFFATFAQAQTAIGEQRVSLGMATVLNVPIGAEFQTVTPAQFGDQVGAKLVYAYDSTTSGTEVRFVWVDLCTVTNGPVSGYRKVRINRFEITDAYWEVTGRVEPGTFTVCSYELIPK